VVTRLTAEWQADYDAWQKLSVWADGIYLQAPLGSRWSLRAHDGQWLQK
jgi:hypothetical protein